MINQIVWGLNATASAAMCLCLLALIKRRLVLRYPILLTFLAIGTIRAVALPLIYAHGGARSYATAWVALQPVALVLHASLALELFVRISRHFLNFRWFGLGNCLAISAGSIFLASLSAAVGEYSWVNVSASLIRYSRYEALACLLFVGISMLFFSQFRVTKLRRNVTRHMVILAALFATLFAGELIAEMGAGGFWYVFAAQIIIQIGSMSCCVAWIAGMTRDGERWSPPQRPSGVEQVFSVMVV